MTIADLPVDNDDHIRLSAEAPAEKIAAWVRKTQKLQVYQLDPPLHRSGRQEARRHSAAPARIAALAWIDERQMRAGSETAFVRRGKKSVALLPPQPTLPVDHGREAGHRAGPDAASARGRSRARTPTCGKGSIDADHKKTERLAAGQLLLLVLLRPAQRRRRHEPRLPADAGRQAEGGRQAALRAAAAGRAPHHGRRSQDPEEQGCGVQSGVRRRDTDAARRSRYGAPAATAARSSNGSGPGANSRWPNSARCRNARDCRRATGRCFTARR